MLPSVVELGVDEAQALSALRVRQPRGRFRAVSLAEVCGATSARAAAGPSTALSGTPLRACTHKERWRVVRGVAGEGGDGEGLGGALRRGGEHGVPLASPVSGGGAERFGGAQGDRGSGRDLRPGEPEGRARAWTQGTAAGRQGEEARPLAREVPVLMAADRSGTTVSAVLPRVDAAALTAALGPGGREGRPAGLRRWRELPTLRRRARGEPRSTQPLEGERVRGDLHVPTGEQPPQ